MDLRLKDKVVLVTAASRGLGAASARRFAEEGARVAITARNGERLTALAQAISKDTGAEVLPIAGDVTQPDDVERMVQSTIDRWGRLDILVTNAGGPAAGKFLDLKTRAMGCCRTVKFDERGALVLRRPAPPAEERSAAARHDCGDYVPVRQTARRKSAAVELGAHGRDWPAQNAVE